MKKWLSAGLVLVGIIIVALIVILAVGGDDGGGNDAHEIVVPINMESAHNIGSIGMSLLYDSSLLEIADVKPGELSENAMIDYSVRNPGQVNIGVIDSRGINGNGTVAVIVFNVTDEEGVSTLRFAGVQTHDAATLIDVINGSGFSV